MAPNVAKPISNCEMRSWTAGDGGRGACALSEAGAEDANEAIAANATSALTTLENLSEDTVSLCGPQARGDGQYYASASSTSLGDVARHATPL